MEDKKRNSSISVVEDAIMTRVIKYFTTPALIEALEGELLSISTNVIPVRHSFCKGLYARQVTIPKGSIAIGHEHSEECLNIVVSGSVMVLVGGEVRLVTGPAFFVSPAHERKVGYVQEDLTWITVHPTKDTDVDTVESKLIVKSDTFRKYEMTHSQQCTSIATCVKDDLWDDRVDYFRCVGELGFTHKQARDMSEDMTDQIEFPAGTGDRVYVATSKIEGNGLFAAFDEPAEAELAPARIFSKRTKAGRYVNHSKHPNCEYRVRKSTGDIYLATIRKVDSGCELTIDYRQSAMAAKEANEILKILTTK